MKRNMVAPAIRCRGGFTLVELLVVVAIIAILVGLGVAATMRFMDVQTNSSTDTLVSKIQVKLNEQYDGIVSRCHKDTVPPPITVYCDNDPERGRTVYTAAMLRVNFPQTFAETTPPSPVTLNTPLFSIGSHAFYPKATFKSVWGVTVTVTAPAATPAEISAIQSAIQSAVLLYMATENTSTSGGSDTGTAGETMTLSEGIPFAFTVVRANNTSFPVSVAIADTTSNTVSFTVFRDPRGAPISFSRWSTHAELHAAPYVNDKPTIVFNDPLDPKGLVSDWTNTASRNALIAAPYNLQFDTNTLRAARTPPKALNRVPSVQTWGKDKLIGNADDVLGFRLNRLGNKGK